MRRIWRVLVVALGLVLPVFAAAPAAADVIANTQWVYGPWAAGSYSNQPFCIENRAEISHGSYNNGYWKFDTQTQGTYLQNGAGLCFNHGGYNMPAGQIAMQVTAMNYNFSTGAWQACFYSAGNSPGDPWFRNLSTADKVVWSHNRGNNGPPCGEGSYHTVGTGIAWYGTCGCWPGGATWSGNNHWLPA